MALVTFLFVWRRNGKKEAVIRDIYLSIDPSGPRLLCYVGPLRKTVRTSRGRTAYRTFVAEVQVRPISRRRHAAGPQPARGASRSCLPGRSRYLFFSVLPTLQPLYSSVLFNCPKKKPNLSRLKGLSQVCTFRTSPRSPPFVRPSISLVLPLFSQDMYQWQWRVGDCAIEQQRTRSVWVRACGCLDTLSALL